ncbi:NUDIX domain-containing protein [Deminuibacter soli]|uniref:NUDIX hydrolase n=1 Tax=Deminuibacter soli TaxID=2291815 RepID=A0A3E1NMK8_9BACT|nr:NUDIX domain-containing protein [Deminuibacter soli]RFM29137.1 NUDIX hydrolase [Deminuibacter soli]
MPNKELNISITVDAVVFGYAKGEGVSVLRTLPGGFVLEEESLEQAMQRELQEETGIKVNYLEQLYTFGKPGLNPLK